MSQTYIEQVSAQMRAKREAIRIANAEHQNRVAQEQAEQARPLVDRVADVISKLTPEQLEAGIRLDDLCAQLSGKYRGNAQPKAVGEALRQLSYVRVRSWRKSDEGFRSLWFRKEV